MASNYFMLTLPEEGNENFLLEYMAAPVSVIENPPLPSDEKINPNMTLGEMMDKKVSPPGMVPTWTDAARKKYEACVSPHIDSYKLAVDTINRGAEEKYDTQTYQYISASIGVASLTDLFGVIRGDKAVRTRWSWKSSPKKAGLGINRVTFWATFTAATSTYVYYRRQALKSEYENFVAQTNFFLKKVNDCRQSNPYDMWRVMTPHEEYLEKVKWTPSGLIHPNRSVIDDLLNPEKKNKMFWLQK